MPFYTPRCQPPYVTSYDPPAFRFTPLFTSPNPLIFPPNPVPDLAGKKKKRRLIRHSPAGSTTDKTVIPQQTQPYPQRKGLENLRKNKQPNEKQYTKRHKSKVRPDRLSVRFPQAKGISGFGNPAEKEGQKRKRKIKLNGVENGMIPRKKTDKKGKKNKVNGVSGFGNLMSRKEAESRNCSAIFICCRRYRLNIP